MQEPANHLLSQLFLYFAVQCLFAAAWGPPIRRPVSNIQCLTSVDKSCFVLRLTSPLMV